MKCNSAHQCICHWPSRDSWAVMSMYVRSLSPCIVPETLREVIVTHRFVLFASCLGLDLSKIGRTGLSSCEIFPISQRLFNSLLYTWFVRYYMHTFGILKAAMNPSTSLFMTVLCLSWYFQKYKCQSTHHCPFLHHIKFHTGCVEPDKTWIRPDKTCRCFF